MGEMGCHHATIPEDILQQLSILSLDANPPPGNETSEKHNATPPRLAHLAATDPLAGLGWNGELARADTDYLADNGAALSKAIDADPVTKEGLNEALEQFKANELMSKAAIVEMMKQV